MLKNFHSMTPYKNILIKEYFSTKGLCTRGVHEFIRLLQKTSPSKGNVGYLIHTKRTINMEEVGIHVYKDLWEAAVGGADL